MGGITGLRKRARNTIKSSVRYVVCGQSGNGRKRNKGMLFMRVPQPVKSQRRRKGPVGQHTGWGFLKHNLFTLSGEQMDNQELNRKLAEELFPAFDLGGWMVGDTSRASSIRGCYEPKDFCKDGNAMLALVKAMDARDWYLVLQMENGEAWFTECQDDEIGQPSSYTVFDDNLNVCRAVAESAAKALGIFAN